MENLKAYLHRITPLNQQLFSRLEKCFTPFTLHKKEYFVREGEYAKQIAFLDSGIVRAFFTNEKGKEYNKHFFVSPSIIGAYSSLLHKQPNKIAQQALTDCSGWVANYSEIEELYDTFHLAERLGRKIAEHYFLEKEQKELEMALLDADARYLLLRKKFPGIESLIPQYQIASYLGISTTQLSRIRKKLSHF